MLSIIICSINDKYLQSLKQNIASKIGVDYEVIVWDNRNKNLGLCEVYNLMAKDAKFPYLCFMHEDIIIETKEWGRIIIEVFNNDEECGLIGVAGGKYKSQIISGWFSGIEGMDYYNIYHLNGSDLQIISNKSEWHSDKAEVCCIDGVFMVAKKNVWQEFQFNDKLLKGFHFYDIDFSMRISNRYKVYVTGRIDIIHFTKGGDYGDKWLEAGFIFHNEFHDNLPYTWEPVDKYSAELRVAQTWLERLQTENISLKNKFRWIRLQKLFGRKGLQVSILKFIIYRPFGFYFIYSRLKYIKRLLTSKT